MKRTKELFLEEIEYKADEIFAEAYRQEEEMRIMRELGRGRKFIRKKGRKGRKISKFEAGAKLPF